MASYSQNLTPCVPSPSLCSCASRIASTSSCPPFLGARTTAQTAPWSLSMIRRLGCLSCAVAARGAGGSTCAWQGRRSSNEGCRQKRHMCMTQRGLLASAQTNHGLAVANVAAKFCMGGQLVSKRGSAPASEWLQVCGDCSPVDSWPSVLRGTRAVKRAERDSRLSCAIQSGQQTN
jgi:hypothetical protein